MAEDKGAPETKDPTFGARVTESALLSLEEAAGTQLVPGLMDKNSSPAQKRSVPPAAVALSLLGHTGALRTAGCISQRGGHH